LFQIILIRKEAAHSIRI